MFSFLTLDQSTLFYWTLSDVPHEMSIDDWVSEIPLTQAPTAPTRPNSTATVVQDPKSTSASGRTKSAIPTDSRSSAPSVLTNNIKVISHQSSNQVKVKAETQADVLSLSDGGLSDNNELGGKEREAAINSPLKGKRRITSEVTNRLFT